MLLVRPQVLLVAAVTLVAAGGLATWAQRAPAPPVAPAPVTSVSVAPDAEGGGALTDACSRRVGCLLR